MNESLDSLQHRLMQLAAEGRPFAAYHLPDSDTVKLLIPRGGARAERSLAMLGSEPAFVAAPFDVRGGGDPVLVFATDTVEEYRIYNRGDETGLSEVKIGVMPIKGRKGETRADYVDTFNSFYEALDGGRFDKLVLARRKTCVADVQRGLPVMMVRAVVRYPGAFTYLFSTPHSGMWMGATPEVLLSGDKYRRGTVALAGTRRHRHDGKNPVWDDKNMREQGFVAAYVAAVLRDAGIDFVEEPARTLVAGRVEHLCSRFSFADPDDFSLGRLVEKLHPTPAVCGLPKAEAQQFILETEPLPRHYYAGFVGPVGTDGAADLFVNLRCLSAMKGEMCLYAGGGIVPGSRVTSEWQETENKMMTMTDLLSPAK